MTQPDRSVGLVLEPEQYETLAQIARQQGSTIPDVVREVVRLGLESFKKQQRQKALERLVQMRQEIFQNSGIYPGNIVSEVRAAREKQIDRIIRGES
jgi:DNA polymerase III delta subunit